MISTKTLAAMLSINERRARVLCQTGRVPGAKQVGGMWQIPDNPTVTDGKRGPKMRGKK